MGWAHARASIVPLRDVAIVTSPSAASLRSLRLTVAALTPSALPSCRCDATTRFPSRKGASRASTPRGEVGGDGRETLWPPAGRRGVSAGVSSVVSGVAASSADSGVSGVAARTSTTANAAAISSANTPKSGNHNETRSGETETPSAPTYVAKAVAPGSGAPNGGRRASVLFGLLQGRFPAVPSALGAGKLCPQCGRHEGT